MRVCIDCGTPKMPFSEACHPCGAQTMTHDGEARINVCTSCRHFEDDRCELSLKHAGAVGFKNRRIDDIAPLLSSYRHACIDGNYSARTYADRSVRPPTANPLSFAQVSAIKLYREAPLAFWLAPDAWEGVDPHRTPMWDREPVAKTSTRIVMAGVALGLLALTKLKTQTSTSTLPTITSNKLAISALS